MKHTNSILPGRLRCMRITMLMILLVGSWLSAMSQIAMRHDAVVPVLPDSADVAYQSKKNFWRASAEVVGFNIGLWAFDRYIDHGDWSYISFKTIARNFREGFKWDNDKLGTNTFLHPYNGNLYFNAGRANGFNYWQSELFAIGGSAMWEMCMECEYPSTNDIIATPIGGAAIGEVLFRASDAVLDDRCSGWPRFGREAAAFLLNPIRGFNRIVTGQAWRRRATTGRLFGTPPFAMRLSVGPKLLQFQGHARNLQYGVAAQLDLEYGNRFESQSSKPYDYFTARAEVQGMRSQPVLSQFCIRGRLMSKCFVDKQGEHLSVGLYQHFDFYDSDTIKALKHVPYKLGIPACVGGGVLYRNIAPAERYMIDFSLHANAVGLAGILSDHYFTDERNYNWASGFSLKAGLNWVFNKKRCALSLSHEYYRLFTWSGYRAGTDLSTVNFRTLNVQGDKSVSSLNRTQARFDFKIYKQLYGTMLFTNWVRSTHYRDFSSVLSSTQSLNLMMSYKF